MKKTLDDWLRWQETLHLSEIDLGLVRIEKVASKLDLLKPDFPIITVAGTNGKGSTVAFLDAMLRAEGYKTGAYTSPHLINYNERIVLNGEQVSDELIIEAFVAIDKARRSIPDEDGKSVDISLTYFEFSTLAAIYIYKKQKVDAVVLEVGLGGRLDAANLWDTSLAIITSIDVDHVDWLGDDRDIIAVEKSGIMRENVPAICGDTNPPKTIASEASRIRAPLQQINTDFSFTPPSSNTDKHWYWQTLKQQDKQEQDTILQLDVPLMPGEFQLNNAATAIAGLQAIQSLLPVSLESINNGLRNAQVMGRLQRLQTSPDWLIDVAHNPHAAQQLAKYMSNNQIKGKTFAIFSMLRDKDVEAVLSLMYPVIDEWHIVATEGSRGLTLDELRENFENLSNEIDLQKDNEQKVSENSLSNITSHASFKQACESLKKMAKEEDRVVAFGSFLVISEILDTVI